MKYLAVPLFILAAATLWAQDRPRCKGSTCDTSRKDCRPQACKDEKCREECEKMACCEEGRTFTFQIYFPDLNPATGGPKIPVKPVSFNLRGKK